MEKVKYYKEFSTYLHWKCQIYIQNICLYVFVFSTYIHRQNILRLLAAFNPGN